MPRVWSSASETTPMPPRPSSRTRRYRPKRRGGTTTLRVEISGIVSSTRRAGMTGKVTDGAVTGSGSSKDDGCVGARVTREVKVEPGSIGPVQVKPDTCHEKARSLEESGAGATRTGVEPNQEGAAQ